MVADAVHARDGAPLTGAGAGSAPVLALVAAEQEGIRRPFVAWARRTSRGCGGPSSGRELRLLEP